MAAASGTGSKLVLYKWPKKWELPSVCPFCIYAEAAVRLTGLSIAVEEVDHPNQSPTGSLPALEDGETLVPSPKECENSPGGAARQILHHLERRGYLLIDNKVPKGRDKLTLMALRTLAETHLGAASSLCIWGDKRTFRKHTKDAYGGSMPALVRWHVTGKWRREALKTLNQPSDKLFIDAKSAYHALDNWIASRKTFFDGGYTSVDLAVMAHVAYQAYAPMGQSDFRTELESHKHLLEYAKSALADIFSFDLPQPPPPSPEKEGAFTSRRREADKANMSEREASFRRGRNQFIALIVGSVAAYILFAGVIDFSVEPDEFEDDEDDDDGI